MKKYTMEDPTSKPDFSEAVHLENKNRDDQDFGSNIAKYSLLKTLIINGNLVHLNDFEVTFWHLINMKMLEEGLWSKFKFVARSDYREFTELLLMTALLAKKLCNTPEEYEIFEEFVFHNYEEVVTTHEEISLADEES
jgi:hypothetical protein